MSRNFDNQWDPGIEMQSYLDSLRLPPEIDFSTVIPGAAQTHGYIPGAPEAMPHNTDPELTDDEIDHIMRHGPGPISNYYYNRLAPFTSTPPVPPFIISHADVNDWFSLTARELPLFQLASVIDHCERWSSTLTINLRNIIDYLRDYTKYALFLGKSAGNPKLEELDLHWLAFHPHSIISEWYQNEQNGSLVPDEISEFVRYIFLFDLIAFRFLLSGR